MGYLRSSTFSFGYYGIKPNFFVVLPKQKSPPGYFRAGRVLYVVQSSLFGEELAHPGGNLSLSQFANRFNGSDALGEDF